MEPLRSGEVISTAAATEMQKMQNIPVVNVGAQLTRMEERMNRMEERILRELRGLRTDVN